jgi:hypothetical protein
MRGFGQSPRSRGVKILPVVTSDALYYIPWMRAIFSILLILSSVQANAAGILPASELEHVRNSVPCVLDFVLKKNWKTFDSAIPLPRVVFSHEVTVEEFNKSVASPYTYYPTVQNAFVPKENTIYLDSRTVVYEKYGKTLIDSLAHELTHYVQHFYWHYTEEDAYSDGAESLAVRTQFAFREEDSNTGLCRN